VDTAAHDVKKSKWICCQIGAREHYVIPAELQSLGQLELLITDFWAKPSAIMANPITNDLQGRRHQGIPNNKVKSFNLSSLSFEITQKLGGTKGWELVMKRNRWFQKKAVSCMQSLTNDPTHLFSYSYAARDIFKYAKRKGWVTVLGQIDPGPLEEEIVLNELHRFPEYKSEWQPAPNAYWENWYEECDLADEIIANSEWSEKALIIKGVPKNKIRIEHLRYNPTSEAQLFSRIYPHKFSKDRPLNVLFLGQIILRKGVARIIAAAQSLIREPIVFTLAGPIGIHPIPPLPNLKIIGRVTRSEVDHYYKNADVFLFPTLSDGYAITQLESFAWQLPIITTPFCGEVVNHQHNGYILPNGTAAEIEEILLEILSNPDKLYKWSQNISAVKNLSSK